MMFEFSTFEEAVASLRRFLNENGHPTDLFWVFRDDVWKRSPTDVLLKYAVPRGNTVLAQKSLTKVASVAWSTCARWQSRQVRLRSPYGSQNFPARKFRVGIAEW
jgi:hypothetical protein